MDTAVIAFSFMGGCIMRLHDHQFSLLALIVLLMLLVATGISVPRYCGGALSNTWGEATRVTPNGECNDIAKGCNAFSTEATSMIVDDRFQDIISLRDGTISERQEAAKHLGEARTTFAVPALILALDDPDQYVRGWAAWALAETGDPSAIDPLLNAFSKYDAMRRTDKLGQQTKCLTDIYVALESLTGQKFGLDVEKWLEWRRRTSHANR
jgi:hypothetical protein